MTTDLTDPLRPPAAAAAATAAPAAAGRGDSPAFRLLIDSLERLAREQRPAEVADADALRSAMSSAEQSFRQVMDLRRHLEQAFAARR